MIPDPEVRYDRGYPDAPLRCVNHPERPGAACPTCKEIKLLYRRAGAVRLAREGVPSTSATALVAGAVVVIALALIGAIWLVTAVLRGLGWA